MALKIAGAVLGAVAVLYVLGCELAIQTSRIGAK
jgi:hypothetical protein